MKKIFLSLFFAPILFLCSCATKVPEHYVAFFLESPARAGTFELQRSFTLPVIDKEIRTGREPVFNIDALSDCIVSEKFDPVMEKSVPGLFFRVKDENEIRLRQLGASSAGRRLLLVADGKPLGFCPVKRDFSRNDLFFYVMTSATGAEEEQQLEELSFELNSYILQFREYEENR